MRNPADSTRLCIIFANKTEADILMREELEKLAMEGRVQVIFTVDIKPDSPDWRHHVGFISADMIKEGMCRLDDRSPFCLLCGPGPMLNLGNRLLQGEGVPEARIFCF